LRIYLQTDVGIKAKTALVVYNFETLSQKKDTIEMEVFHNPLKFGLFCHFRITALFLQAKTLHLVVLSLVPTSQKGTRSSSQLEPQQILFRIVRD